MTVDRLPGGRSVLRVFGFTTLLGVVIRPVSRRRTRWRIVDRSRSPGSLSRGSRRSGGGAGGRTRGRRGSGGRSGWPGSVLRVLSPQFVRSTWKER